MFLCSTRFKVRVSSAVDSNQYSILTFLACLISHSPSFVQSTETIGQGAISGVSQRPRYDSFSSYEYWLICLIWSSPLTASIHILDNDSLLNIFHLYRPFILVEDEDEDDRLARDGSADAGGIIFLMFAKDGETPYLGRHPT